MTTLRQGDASWSNPKVLAIFTLIFLCGLVCGAVATSTFFHNKIAHASSSRQMSLSQLRSELNLTPEQERIVGQELDDYAKFYWNIEDERRSVAQQGKQNIAKVLTPEQRKRFVAIFDFNDRSER